MATDMCCGMYCFCTYMPQHTPAIPMTLRETVTPIHTVKYMISPCCVTESHMPDTILSYSVWHITQDIMIILPSILLKSHRAPLRAIIYIS